jgi:hypothetical protein
MRQGVRESNCAFKARYDKQVEANRKAGVPDPEDSMRAYDFIYKLDSKRHGQMKTHMHNNAVLGVPNAFPQTLEVAYRAASLWTNV